MRCSSSISRSWTSSSSARVTTPSSRRRPWTPPSTRPTRPLADDASPRTRAIRRSTTAAPSSLPELALADQIGHGGLGALARERRGADRQQNGLLDALAHRGHRRLLFWTSRCRRTRSGSARSRGAGGSAGAPLPGSPAVRGPAPGSGRPRRRPPGSTSASGSSGSASSPRSRPLRLVLRSRPPGAPGAPPRRTRARRGRTRRARPSSSPQLGVEGRLGARERVEVDHVGVGGDRRRAPALGLDRPRLFSGSRSFQRAAIGAAMAIDDRPPARIPTIRAKAKSFSVSPPKKYSTVMRDEGDERRDDRSRQRLVDRGVDHLAVRGDCA